MKYSVAVLIRIINIILNVGTGIILARNLSVNDRGEVAIIISVTSAAVMLYSAVYSEKILKKSKSNFNTGIQEIEFNFVRILVTCALALLFIQNSIENIPFFLLSMSLFMIIFVNLNTLFNSVIHNKKSLIVNQLFLFFLTLLYFTLLLLYSFFSNNTVTSWMIILNLSNFCTFIGFILYFKIKKIKIKVLKKFNMKRISLSDKLRLESWAVYSAAMSQQILIIEMSQFFTSDYLAKIAILLSLFSIIGIPLVPILPNLISSPNSFFERLVTLGFKDIFRMVIVVSIYGLVISAIIEVLFPYMYGEKYAQLSETVPIVVLSAIGFSVSQCLSSISRGLGFFGLSAILNLFPLLSIPFCSFILTFSINTLFVCIAISYFGVSIFAYVILKRKYFNPLLKSASE